MANFIRAANPIWFFVDLLGLPLNDEYYISFLENTFPYLPQVIYRDNQGLIPWGDPVQFLSNGTLPDNLYFNDTQVFRLEIRHGALQSDALIYEINDFVPGGEGGGGSTETGTEDNQISNPQFSLINFTSPLSITASGTYSVAPGWDLVLTGSGTATVSQLVFTGAQNLENSPVPPYALRIVTTGWTIAVLQQTFSGNGAIWSNEFVSMSILARTSNGVSNTVSLVYSPNSPGTPQTINSAVLASGFQIIQGVIALPESTNTTLNNAAYVNMQIVLPPTAGSVDISNVQVMGQVELLAVDFAQTPEETIERQIDHLFHYYKNSIIIQPKNTILTGWNFGLNPFQFTFSGAPTINTVNAQYVTDQTIFKAQSANTLSVSQNTTTYGSINIQAIMSTTQAQFAIIQYIDPSTMFGYWGTKVSSLIKAFIGSSGVQTAKMKMRLIYRSTLPASIGAVEPIVSYDANGDPVFAAGWTAIKPTNDPAYPVSLSDSLRPSLGLPFSFNGFQLPSSSAAAQTLGIVFYITGVLDSAIAQQFFVNEISLVPNDFAIDSSPETFDQSLRKCEFYYEKSYDNTTLSGTSTGISSLSRVQTASYSGGNGTLYAAPFEFEFRTVKRAAPTSMGIFAPSNGGAGSIDTNLWVSGSATPSQQTVLWATYWNNTFIGTKSTEFRSKSATAIIASVGSTIQPFATVDFHYVADARLGL